MAKKLFLLGLLLAFTLAVLIVVWWRWANLPVQSKSSAEKIFVVPQGQVAKSIGQRLFDEGLIRSRLAFELLLDRQGLENQLQAGDFKLSPAMNLSRIIQTLAHGTLDYWITFPEGWRVEEYAARLAENSDFDPQAFILAAKPYEGRLFPDTYLIPKNASAEDIVSILTDNFEGKFAPLRKEVLATNLSESQVIILASLIEREARHQTDRPLVASVLHNRLRIGMALQVDASVQYILGKANNWWPKNLSPKDLKTPSVYNTYLHSGLPPAPIANPGLASLEAAIHPAQTNYLYYLSDASGNNHYAEDLETHNQNIAKYLH
jgi:UPF0755 protein